MNRDDELIGRLEDYLDSFDGATPLPARVRDAIRAELPQTRQVRPRPGPGRVFRMLSITTARVPWVVAAALVVAVGLGAVILNGNGNQPGVGAAPTPVTPAPTPATPAPSPSVASPTPIPDALVLMTALSAPCRDGDTTSNCVEPGTYTLTPSTWPALITLDVPRGWFTFSPGPGAEGILVDSGADAPDGSGWGLVFMLVDTVSRNPCDAAAGTFAPSDVATPEALAAAMATWPGFRVSSPAPIEVGGGGASGVEVTVSSTARAARCATPVIWRTPLATPIDAYPMIGDGDVHRTATFRILDVRGHLVVLRTTEFGDISPFEASQGVKADPTRHTADLGTLRTMVDSVRVGLGRTP